MILVFQNTDDCKYDAGILDLSGTRILKQGRAQVTDGRTAAVPLALLVSLL